MTARRLLLWALGLLVAGAILYVGIVVAENCGIDISLRLL
jgi:hypothetical protein